MLSRDFKYLTEISPLGMHSAIYIRQEMLLEMQYLIYIFTGIIVLQIVADENGWKL